MRTVAELPFVVIWSDEHRAWWRPEGLGYTERIEEAGLYLREEVPRWVHNNKHHRAVQLGAVAPRRAKGTTSRRGDA